MKILFTVATYYPSKDGVQYVTQYEAEGLVNLGHNVTVITSSKKTSTKEEIHNGVRIIRVDAYNKNMFHYGDKKAFQDLVKAEALESDVMICVCLQSFAADWVLPIIDDINCNRILLMHGMHDFAWNRSDFTSLSSVIKKTLRNIRWSVFYKRNWSRICRFDKVIHLHEKDKAYLFFNNNGYTENYVLYNGVQDDLFVNDTKQKSDYIINIGSFNKRKNQLLALKAFYRASTGNYSLIIIGNPENDYYHKLIKKKEEYDRIYVPKKVQILCNISRQETIEYIKNSRLYLCCSTWEAFPISIVESMAAHMAFVSTDVGIVPSLPGGVICTNEDQLIEGLEQLISTKHILEQYADKAFAFAVENLRQSKQIENLLRIISSLS